MPPNNDMSVLFFCETKTCYITQTGLEFSILLFSLPSVYATLSQTVIYKMKMVLYSNTK